MNIDQAVLLYCKQVEKLLDELQSRTRRAHEQARVASERARVAIAHSNLLLKGMNVELQRRRPDEPE